MKRNLFALLALFVATQAHALFVPSQGNFNGGHGGSVFVAGSGGTPMLGVRNDGGASVLAPINLGYGPLSIDANGNLFTVSAAPSVIAAGHVRKDYTAGSVTTSAYTQIVAATAEAATAVEVFDSSGQTMVLATGAPGSEVDQFYIFPGGNDARIKIAIPVGTSLSLKAVSQDATVGEDAINFYQ